MTPDQNPAILASAGAPRIPTPPISRSTPCSCSRPRRPKPSPPISSAAPPAATSSPAFRTISLSPRSPSILSRPQPPPALVSCSRWPARRRSFPPLPSRPSGPIAAFGRASVLSIDDHKPKRRTGLAVAAGIGWAAAAALAVAASFLFGDRQALRDTLATRTGQVMRLNADAASAHQLMDALTDPAAVRVSLTAQPQTKPLPAAGVTYNPDKGSLIFLASNLNPLQQYKAYELWIIPTAENAAPIPVGTFRPDQQGSASIILPDLPKGIAAKAFGITIEPDGGSQTPTLPIIMAHRSAASLYTPVSRTRA